MYSNIRSVQILVALLKKNNIQDIVLSPGGSDIPLIHSIETDSYFNCYSVVDERSAAYFALGLAQMKNNPCVCICTSGTAVCNYVPGITEAFYQGAQVLAITADKNPYYQSQLETQKIVQTNMFDGVVKKAVELPIIRSGEDEWLCNRLVNEALLSLNHHGTGPVHINIPIVGRTDVYDCETLPDERLIRRVSYDVKRAEWDSYAQQLTNKKILVVVGQNVVFTNRDIENLNQFYKKYDCVYAVEHLSNLECEGRIFTYPLTEMKGHQIISKVKPDIVISLGNNLAAYQLKPMLRANYKSIQNWLISEAGEVRDAYKCLTDIFECSASFFFERILEVTASDVQNEHEYFRVWKEEADRVIVPQFDFSNFYVAQKLAEVIPADSVLHLAILNSTRVMQYFKLASRVKTFSNVGTLGIDGCFSTFAGQAAVSENLAYLVIGDLSFFYDMNAAGLQSIGKNVRVILLNNGGGSEFHFFMGKDRIPTINTHISAEHCKRAEGWIRSLGYEYFSASTAGELDEIMPQFGQESDKPLFLEVFTNMEEDAQKTNSFYGSNREKEEKNDPLLKGFVKSVVPEKYIKKALDIVDILKSGDY